MTNSLLFAISSLGSMSMDQYNSYFDTLFGQKAETCDDFNLKDARNRMIRALDSLGYCEFDRRHVTVCDPAIVPLPHSGIPRAIYTGARTRGMLSKISSFAKSHRNEIFIRFIPQFLNVGIYSNLKRITFELPDTILIEAASKTVLVNLAEQSGIKTFLSYSPSPILANFSVDVVEYKRSLSQEILTVPDWPARTFDTDKLIFKKGKPEASAISITAYVSQINQQLLHIYTENNRNFEIDRDWGRYLVLHENEVRVILYDAKRQSLAIPATVPLPRLLARAVTICSGRTPISSRLNKNCNSDIPQNHPIDIYQAVPRTIALDIAEKLGEKLVDWDASEYFGG